MSNEAANNLTKLVGRGVQFGISEPWDVGVEAPIPATIIATQQHMILLRLEVPLTYQQQTVLYLVGTPRHGGHEFDELLAGHAPSANFTPAPSTGIEDDSSPEQLFAAAAAWRAWHFIGGIKLK